MATEEDAQAVRSLVIDAASFLDWCAGPQSFIVDEGRPQAQAVPEDMRPLYAAAVDQLLEIHVPLALRTLQGENERFPFRAVLELLAATGWDGPMRDFKLASLERSGRAQVTEVTARGRQRGGRMPGWIIRPFTGVLNAALDSLEGVPGVGAIRELKDFLEKLLGR